MKKVNSYSIRINPESDNGITFLPTFDDLSTGATPIKYEHLRLIQEGIENGKTVYFDSASNDYHIEL